MQEHKSKRDKAEVHKHKATLSRWLKVYGWNASLTTLVCIYAIWIRGYYPSVPFISMTTRDKLQLIGLYVPYLLLPLYLVFFA